MQLKHIDKVVHRFMERTSLLGTPGIEVYEAPTEELVDMFSKGPGKTVTLHARNRRARRIATGRNPNRLEENYLYSTRRFPSIATNTFASGVAVGTYSFFTAGLGQDGQPMGFPTGFALTDVETNMEGTGGQVAMGSNFVFNQIGVSFDSHIVTSDAALLMEMGALRFAKSGGQFGLNHGPVRLWPGGVGLQGYVATTAATTTIGATHNGNADIRAVRKLSIPRIIREKEQFSYQYVVPRATLAKDGTTIAMTAFSLMTVWLWGAAQIQIPS